MKITKKEEDQQNVCQKVSLWFQNFAISFSWENQKILDKFSETNYSEKMFDVGLWTFLIGMNWYVIALLLLSFHLHVISTISFFLSSSIHSTTHIKKKPKLFFYSDFHFSLTFIFFACGELKITQKKKGTEWPKKLIECGFSVHSSISTFHQKDRSNAKEEKNVNRKKKCLSKWNNDCPHR
jgi:hypothetical protein